MTDAFKAPLFLGWLVLLAGAGLAEEVDRVEVRVTYVSGDSAYLDKGRSSGLDVGDTVEFLDPGRGRLEAELVVVSTTTARAVMRGGLPPPEPGVRGEVRVPADRSTGAGDATAPAEPPAGGEAPEHPPWERREEPRDPDQPLLSPPFVTSRTEREPEWRGRIWTHLLATSEQEGRTARYYLARAGVDASGNNLFGFGGVLRIRVEGDHRTIDVDGGRDDADTDFRIDRLSYEWGGGVDSPILVKIGRFLPRDTPELGLLDGAEVTLDVGFGRLGVGLGAFPEPLPDRRSFDDLGGTISWRYAAGDNESFVGLVAFQQTWHEGDRDRSLVLARVGWVPDRDVSLFGSAWVDHYDGADEIKGPGFELTEAHLNGAFRLHPDHRVRADVSYLRWPEIARHEFPATDAEFVEDNRVIRFAVSTDHDLGDHLRLDTRIGRWADQDDDGWTGHVKLAFPDLVAPGATVSVTGFRTDGSTSEGIGARVSIRQVLPVAYLSLAYEIVDREFTSLGGGSRDVLQQALLASADFSIGPGWSVSVNGDYRFGDDQDALSLGVFLQYRF